MIPPVRRPVRKRWEAICELLEAHGRVSVEDLCRRFRVSSVTIRRDLELLQGAGRLIRTHGGATQCPPPAFSFLDKIRRARPEKEAIGHAAASLVKPGDSVIVDNGSTPYLAARFLRLRGGITVVTNSLPAMLELMQADGVEIVLLGGMLNRITAEFTGPALRAGLAGLRAHWAFLGADGLTAARGAQAASPSEADIARLLAEHAQRVVILADTSKLGRESFASYLSPRQIHTIITAGHMDSTARAECQRFRELGVKVVQIGKWKRRSSDETS